FARLRPVLNNLDLGVIHGKTVRGENVAEEFDSLNTECALLKRSKETGFPKAPKHLTDMRSVFRWVLRIDQDVIQVYNDTLDSKSSTKIRTTLVWHHKPLEGSIARSESGFPFVAIGDPDQVVSMF
ncbi:hypothetical protein B0H19DRAFT_973398, partial [Mycena capillaripes]